MKKGINTHNIKNEKQFLAVDNMINMLTIKAIELVPESKQFGILTACLIDSKFVLVTNYEINDTLGKKLKRAMYKVA